MTNDYFYLLYFSSLICEMDKTHAAWDHLFHQQHKKGFTKKSQKKDAEWQDNVKIKIAY